MPQLAWGLQSSLRLYVEFKKRCIISKSFTGLCYIDKQIGWLELWNCLRLAHVRPWTAQPDAVQPTSLWSRWSQRTWRLKRPGVIWMSFWDLSRVPWESSMRADSMHGKLHAGKVAYTRAMRPEDVWMSFESANKPCMRGSKQVACMEEWWEEFLHPA